VRKDFILVTIERKLLSFYMTQVLYVLFSMFVVGIQR